jgi:Predicted hydrolase (metallo-beta-lactamase superfamily)
MRVVHHGSKYSSAEFLKIIKPEYAIISCGQENSYGYPHKELLERLKQCGSKILITKDQGAAMVETDGERIFIQK